MPKVSTIPKNLKPFIFHGVELTWSDEHGQAVGDCPFCSKEGKLYVAIDTSKWDCKRCDARGNGQTFLRQLHERSVPWVPTASGGAPDTTSINPVALGEGYKELAAERSLMSPSTLAAWGVGRSPITTDWLLPGYSPDGVLKQLYKYTSIDPDGRKFLMPTPGFGHGLLGLHLLGSKVDTIYLSEGPWDGMALWEVMRSTRVISQTERGPILASVSDPTRSMLHRAAVLCVPSCSVFDERWSQVMAGKHVILMYDSDHPLRHRVSGELQPPAGLQGMKRVCEELSISDEPPSQVSYLRWGPEGYDPTLKDGFDVRDHITAGGDLNGRIKALQSLLTKVSTIPADWVEGRSIEARRKGRVELSTKPCTSWKELIQAWRLTMKWTEGLDRGLSCMLAVITSTKAVGDQLWMKIIGPPSCGKSVLCEAVSVARKHIHATSTIRGFHSGYKVDAEGSEDVSLVAKLRDKTLVIKDGDTLLQSPNLGQILSEARDIYDRVARTHFRNRISRNYEGLNITIILSGTEGLRVIDRSELGERFLDCVVVHSMDDALEDEIAWRVANQADMALTYESNGRAEDQHEPGRVEAMQLTGGYVEYLRQNAHRLLNTVKSPEWTLRRCTKLARFVSYLRARPPNTHKSKDDMKAQRELSFRLVAQHVRLAKCLAVVLNRKEVDVEVMRRVTCVSMDTARGRSLDMVMALHKAGANGLDLKTLTLIGHQAEAEVRHLLRFMSKIDVIEPFRAQVTRGFNSPLRWKLTTNMNRLYGEISQYEVEGD